VDEQLTLSPDPHSRLDPLADSFAISLGRGLFAIVDIADRDLVAHHRWYVSAGGYVVWSIRSGGRKRTVYLHRVVSGAPDSLTVDHMNGNKLDNRRANLRLCTRAENVRNARRSKNNTSGYKGVAWYRRRKLWQAQIMMDRETIHLGLFPDRVDAALAYDLAAIEHHGEFAHPNFLRHGSPFKTREAAADQMERAS
jgi:hypothetical protein